MSDVVPFRACFTFAGWGALSIEQGAQVVALLVTALATADHAWRLANPGAPLVRDAGVIYSPDPAILIPALCSGPTCNKSETVEVQWLDTPALYAAGRGDCKALSAARMGELWAAGEDAEALVTLDSSGQSYHVQVQTARGVEDLSLELGMGEYG